MHPQGSNCNFHFPTRNSKCSGKLATAEKRSIQLSYASRCRDTMGLEPTTTRLTVEVTAVYTTEHFILGLPGEKDGYGIVSWKEK
jgi:hypothetical protein